MRCAVCEAENRESRKFCSACGAALPLRCARCGGVNDPSDRFCGGCGAALPSTPSSAPGVHELEGDRRPVVVLFCDLVGYTRLSSRLDPEEVHALLQKFFDVVDRTVERYGGVIDKHIGDATMALFGAPRSHGDDALRAVRAALDIQAAAPVALVVSGAPLAVHIGVAMGEVVASPIGSDRRRDYTVTGEAANLAARLLDRARPGETLVSAEVKNVVARADFESLGPCDLKGIEYPVEIWRLAGMRRDGAAGPAFVGRSSELAQCRALLAAVGEGSSGAVAVVRGEPGIGKTRFLEEAQSAAEGLGFAGHAGFVLDFGTERGQGAIRTIVASLIGVPSDASPKDVELAVAASTQGAGPPNDAALYLRDLLEAPQPDGARSLYEALDASARARGRARALANLVAVAARRKPVLVTVEDVHWADAETLALLAALARAVGKARAALVMTTRTGTDPLDAAWRAMAGDSVRLTLDLAPLTPEDARSIASRFPAAETFARKCVERAGGNPLFLEQLLRTAGELVEGQMPSSIQNVVLARTDLLAAADKRAIAAASVLGQRFTLASLRALLGDERYVCDALFRNALVRPLADGMQFVHALVREGVYASLTRARRRQLHKLAAEIFAGDSVLRAEHLDLADNPAAPRAYLTASGDQSALFRQDQAATLATRGLAIAVEPRDRVDLALLLGDLQLDAGRGAEALEAYGRALAAGATEQDRLRALIGRAAANRLVARIDDAFAALAEAQPGAGGDDRSLAEIHYLRGGLHFARGELRACRDEHALALGAAERVHSLEWRARALSGLADAHYMDCRMATALANFSECVEICDANGWPRIGAPNRVMMGHCRIYSCDFDTALADMRKALETAQRIGNRHTEMFALHSTGFCLVAAGRYAEIGDIHRQALDQAQAVKARRYEAIILAQSAEAALAEGKWAEANSLVREGLETARETGLGFVGPVLYGLLSLLNPDSESQRAALSAGEALLEKGAVGHNHFWFRRYAIEQALLAGDWGEAGRHADALERRTSAEPLSYARLICERGRALAKRGRDGTGLEIERELERLRAEAAAVDFRLDALAQGLAQAMMSRP